VLKWKAEAERLVRESGLPYTILRPSRLTDGPYTSFDLNTLLQGTAGARRSVQLSPRDDQVGEASRIAVAGAPCPAPFLPLHGATAPAGLSTGSARLEEEKQPAPDRHRARDALGIAGRLSRRCSCPGRPCPRLCDWAPLGSFAPHCTDRRHAGGCAEAILQALGIPETEGRAYAISSKEGNGPGAAREQWRALFQAAA